MSAISAKLGGQGGKKGHSNMTHWTGTEEIKARFWRKERRRIKNMLRRRDYQ